MADSCNVMRRKLVRHSKLNLATGASEATGEQWVTEACGAPLFGDTDKAGGKCKSCRDGWTHPENYPVE